MCPVTNRLLNKESEMDIPEVRQCTDDEDPMFGCVAVKSAVPFGDWLVANPGVVNMNAAGGHWAPDAEVEGWVVLDEAEDQPPAPAKAEQPNMPTAEDASKSA
jgi:hypothetical protein